MEIGFEHAECVKACGRADRRCLAAKGTSRYEESIASPAQDTNASGTSERGDTEEKQQLKREAVRKSLGPDDLSANKWLFNFTHTKTCKLNGITITNT